MSKSKSRGDRVHPSKTRFSLLFKKTTLNKLRAIASRNGASIAQIIERMCTDAIEQESQFGVFFANPAVRRIFADMIQKPGALAAMMKAGGQTIGEEFPFGAEQTAMDFVSDLLQTPVKKG